MKATARQTKPKSPGAAGPRPARAQAKAPRGAGNRHRADVFERQAEEIAARFIRGEKELARHVRPRSTAGYQSLDGGGSALPVHLRQGLEEAFGADLNAVRLHTGAAADLAARDFGADAFASGRHVYFRSGRFSPHTSAGRELLVHEIVHVLQQTGRRNSRGVLVALDRTGSAEPQFQGKDEGPFRDSLVSFLAAGTNAAVELAKRHRAAADSDESLKKLTEAVARLAPTGIPRKSDSTVGDWLIKAARDGKFLDDQGTEVSLSIPALGFLVDCLKVCDTEPHFEAATALLDADKDFAILTAFAARTGFRSFLTKNRDETWIFEAYRHPLLKPLWPYKFQHTFAQFFLAPGRDIQALYGLQELRDKEFANRDATTGALSPSDRVILALDQIRDYDNIRQEWLRSLRKAAEEQIPDLDPVNKLYVLATLMRDHLAKEMARKNPAFWATMISELRRITDDAVKLWGDVIAADKELRNAFEGEDLFSGLLTISRPFSGAHDSLKPLRAFLGAMDKKADEQDANNPFPGLLYLESRDKKPVVPSPEEYAKRIQGLDRLLGLRSNVKGNVMLTLQSRLVDLSLQKKLPSDEAKAIGWTIYLLQSFAKTLHGYDASKDSASYPDLRLQHRRDVARWLVPFSQSLSWPEVHSIAVVVLQGADFPYSYLVVPGPWVRIDNAPIEQLAKDFAPDEVFSSLPLTPRELVFYFSGAFLRGVAKLVQAEVDRVNATPQAKLQAKQLNSDILALPRPWRIDPPLEAERVVRAEDENTIDAITLIERNPRSVAEIGRLGSESNLGASPPWVARKRSAGSSSLNPLAIFAWILPDLKPIIQELQNTEPFKSRMEGVKAAEFEWLKMLLEKPGVAGKTVRAEIDEALVKYAQEGQRQAQSAMRQFTILNRRQAADSLRLSLRKFAADSSVKNYAIPYHFANGVIGMAVAVVPSIDEKQQTALFLLDLAPDLLLAFGSARQAARLQPFLLTFFMDAVKFSKEASSATQAGASQQAKDYYGQFLYRNPKDSSQDESLARLVGNAGDLKTVIAAMEEAAKSLQQIFGFLSRDGVTLQSMLIGPAIDVTPLHLLNPFRETPLVNDPKILPGEATAMEIDGDDWELVQVHRKFFYHPALENMAPGSAAAKAVLIDDKEKPIPSGTLLMTFLKNGEEVLVTAGDDATLKKLSDAVFDHTLVLKLEQMGAEIEEDMNFLMDLVELVPGVGQEFATQRALAMTVGAVAAGEYDELFKTLKEDPIGFIKKLAGDLVEKYITVEGVLTFIVLGQGGIDWSRWRKPSKSGRPPQTKNPPRGKIARLIAMLRRLGARIANAIGWVQLRTAPLLRAVQSTIATRPRVGWLLRRSLDVATWLASLIPPDSGASPRTPDERRLDALKDLAEVDPAAVPTPPPTTSTASEVSSLQTMLGPVGQGMAAAASEFRAQLSGLLDTLSEMELPKEVFPLKYIVDVVSEFVLTRLGAKVKFAFKALKAVGVVGAVQTKVAEKLRGAPGDPNLLWQEHILSKIDDEFHALRNRAVESVYGITNTLADETGLGFLGLGPPPLLDKGAFKIQRAEFPKSEVGEFPEGELYRPPQRRVEPLPGVQELPTGSGQALPPALRQKAETHFGHDFGHVRVHAEPEAKELLEMLGAEALTSGSHVYLDSGPQLDESTVLRHELTHVLQQAGERPLGADYPTQPVPGRPGLGVRLYPERESEADFHARRRSQPRGPIRVRKAAGVQASGLDQGLLDKLITSFTEIESAKQFEKTPSGTVPGLEAANHFMGAFVRRLENKSLVVFPDCFEPVAADILAYVKSSGMLQEVPKIAALAQQPVSGKKQKRKTETELNFPRFVTLFEGALFGKTGIAAQITAKEKPQVEISKVEITYIHFGAVRPSTKEALKLWEQVVANTPGLPSVSKKTNLYFEIFEWLHALGVLPFAWELGKKQFRFSGDFVEAFTKTRKQQLAGKVPKKTVYLDDTRTDGLGLNVGIHSGQKGERRESHHTTQFLLIQFFRNDNTVKAWDTGRDYPGITPTSGQRRAFNMDGATALGLHELDKDSGKRGAQMPAILISTDTHRRGQLHVERETQWKGAGQDPDSDPGQGRSTQGFAIKARFQRGLRSQFQITDHDAAVWNKTTAGLGKAESAKRIGKAMLATYKWMNELMMPALERGLVTRERAYYNAMAARDGHTLANSQPDPNYYLNAEDMRGVFGKAKTNNKQVMEAAHWTL